MTGDEEAEELGGRRYFRMPPEPPAPEGLAAAASSASFRLPESARVFDELPRARIVGVSRPDAGDITPMLLSYTIEVHYKQVRPRGASLLFPCSGGFVRECVIRRCGSWLGFDARM